MERIIHNFIDIFDHVLGSVREPLLVLDADLKIVRGNEPFYKTFEIAPKNVVGLSLYEISGQQWDIPKLRELLEKILPHNGVIHDFEVEHEFPTLGRKILHLNARKILDDANQTHLILLAIEDVTEREHHRIYLEDLVNSRTAELMAAKDQAEKDKQVVEIALLQVRTLKKQLEAERSYLQEEIRLEYNHENIVGQSDALKYVLFKAEQIAQNNTTVLILGETGTGKELVARVIHKMSLRADRPLLKLNCAVLPPSLIDSELFGHEKGAFTSAGARRLGRFEVANGATLFLDEIGELPLELQSKLLRVIQEGEFERLGSSQTIKVDVRLIAATNRNLEEEVRLGRFRSDLWYRLNVFPITMPPLRDRLDDIPALVEFYVKKICKRMGKSIDLIPISLLDTLQTYHWPGNVRELENVLERAVINSSGPKLHLADEFKRLPKDTIPSLESMEYMERNHVLRVLEHTNWKVSGNQGAADILGLNRSTLRARMRKLGIHKPES